MSIQAERLFSCYTEVHDCHSTCLKFC